MHVHGEVSLFIKNYVHTSSTASFTDLALILRLLAGNFNEIKLHKIA